MQPRRGRGDQLIAALFHQLAGVRLGVGKFPAGRARGEMDLDRRALVSGRFAVDIRRQERFEVLAVLHRII
jgi:hypothetical protein